LKIEPTSDNLFAHKEQMNSLAVAGGEEEGLATNGSSSSPLKEVIQDEADSERIGGISA
jgi:hypothetical protein